MRSTATTAILWVVIVTGFFAGGVSARAEQINIVASHYFPFQYMDNDQVAGIAAEVVKEVIKEATFKGQIRLYPWARAYETVLKEKNTLIFSMARIQEREKLFKWVGTVTPYNIYFFKLKARKDIVIHTLEDAKQYTVGALHKDVREQYLRREGFPDIAVVYGGGLNIQKLYKGRIDLLPFDETGFAFEARQQGLDLSKVEKAFYLEEISTDLYMAFNKETPDEIVEDYRQALEKVKADGRYEAIKKRYLE